MLMLKKVGGLLLGEAVGMRRGFAHWVGSLTRGDRCTED
jgi:hypothetical protein